MRILVVEDDSVTRLHLEYLAQAFGYEVVSAPNVAAAWQHLADRTIRIVLADWWMPGVNGPEFCRQIRERGGPYVYFILVTNQADSAENFAATSSAGIDDFMNKPVRPDELKHRLAAALRALKEKDSVPGA
jgi:DNA-binding response OmpR family regulator